MRGTPLELLLKIPNLVLKSQNRGLQIHYSPARLFILTLQPIVPIMTLAELAMGLIDHELLHLFS